MQHRRRSARVAQTGERGRRGSGALVLIPLAIAYMVALGWGVWTAKLPFWILALWFAVNLAAFMAYWNDKFAATKKQWRTPEDSLHFWGIAGGWPGAWFAQQVLRHKSAKAAFQSTYWLTVWINCAMLGGWLWWQSTPHG